MITSLVSTLVAVALIAVTPATIRAQTPAGLEQEVKSLATTLRSNRAQLMKLKPNAAQIAQIAATDEDAKLLAAYADKSFARIPEAGLTAEPDQTEVVVTSGDALPGGYTQQAAHFKKDIAVYGLKYVAPGKTTGMAYDGLIKLGDAWIMIPKMWQAFVSETGQATASEKANNENFVDDSNTKSSIASYEESFEEDEEFPAHRKLGTKIDGKLEGDVRFIDKNNRIVAVSTHMDGNPHGTLTQYYPDGKVYCSFDFVNGIPHGEFRRFYPDGQIMQLEIWQNGMAWGPSSVFYPNGQKAYSCLQIKGKLNGTHREYTTQGTLFKVVGFLNGVEQEGNYVIKISKQEEDELAKELEFSYLTFPQVWKKNY
jgi:antitoxin component YwqK of YwqJK toxin-antitoxin module